MNSCSRSALALGLLVLSPVVEAQVHFTAAGSSSECAPRRPLGIYAKVNISDDILALKNGNSPTTPLALNHYFNGLYAQMLQDPAIAGLEIQVHWDTLNPNQPPLLDVYDWDYLDDAFNQAKVWNDDHPDKTPKTIQLIVTPGFQSPTWVLDNIPSCDELFGPEDVLPPADCGKVTFDGFIEEADSNQFPLPWNTYYIGEWEKFLKAVAAKYLLRTEFVSIAVAGPTAASAEMIVPNSDNLPLQKQFSPPISANDMWLKLLTWEYPKQKAYQGTDLAFIVAWDNAIEMYGNIFPRVTLVATTGSGLPNFSSTYTLPPEDFRGECANENMDCAAEADILSYFAAATVAIHNAKASQTSGLEAWRANNQDLGARGVRFLSSMTANATGPLSQILGGMEFNTSFATKTTTLKEGCTSEFPPDPKELPPGCMIRSTCTTQTCLPVQCIPQVCLAPGITADFLISKNIKMYGQILSDTDTENLQYQIPPEQAFYNVLQGFFTGTQGSSFFGGTAGDAPLNYMQIYAPDIIYAEDHVDQPAEVVESSGTIKITAETLLLQASLALTGIADPSPDALTQPWRWNRRPAAQDISHPRKYPFQCNEWNQPLSRGAWSANSPRRWPLSLCVQHHPVFLSPAEMPLMVAAMARFTSGVSSPARFLRSIST
jgi:hypothetical protein